MNLALFDFDGTLTKRDSLVDFLHFYTGTLRFSYKALLSMPALLLWMLKLSDSSAAKEKILSIFLKNESELKLKQKGYEFIEFLIQKNKLKEEVLLALQRHLARKDVCYIISASPETWIEPFAEKFKVNFISTRLEYSGGLFTGRFEGKNCKGEEKVKRLLKELNPSNYNEISAYGNSKDDKEMIALAHKKHWIK